MSSHLSDEEWNAFANSPEAHANREHRLANILAEYPKEELVAIGYLNEAGEIVEPELAGAIPYRGHFRERNWLEKWERQKAHLIARHVQRTASKGIENKS